MTAVNVNTNCEVSSFTIHKTYITRAHVMTFLATSTNVLFQVDNSRPSECYPIPSSHVLCSTRAV